MSEAVEGRCPGCGAVVSIGAGGNERRAPVACHECHRIFKVEEIVATQPPSGMLNYFGQKAASPEGGIFVNGAALAAMYVAAGAVAMGIAFGLMEPAPTFRRLGGFCVALGGATGAVLGGMALTRKSLGHVDRSLSITSIAMGALCMAAGVVLFTGWRI
jgi:hypothetical protein